MSHFSVLVVTPTRPSKDELQEILLPWHKYECTGIERYLVDVDQTDEIAEEFNKRQNVVILADGSIHSRWDERFYTKPKQEDDPFARKEFALPEGAREDEIDADEARKHGVGYADMEACAEDYCGAVKGDDGRFYKKTNPNAKWDWWTVGGRYNGKFAIDYSVEGDPKNYELCWLCEGTGKRNDELGIKARLENPAYTCNGCDGSGKRLKFSSDWVEIGNEIEASNLLAVLPALKRSNESDAAREWDQAEARFKTSGGYNGHSFTDALALWNETVESARAVRGDRALWQVINEQPNGEALRAAGNAAEWHGISSDAGDRARHAASAHAVTAFAVVKDGQWAEQGNMGWFGIVTDEQPKDAWQQWLNAMVLDLQPGQWLTVVDCHI